LFLFVAVVVLAHLWRQAKEALWEMKQAEMFEAQDWSEPVVDSWSCFQQPPKK
jgi:predicted alpha/beta hydrolase family esterase